jgi:hypothetical protein
MPFGKTLWRFEEANALWKLKGTFPIYPDPLRQKELPLTRGQAHRNIPASGYALPTLGSDDLPLPHTPQDRRRGHGCGL